MNTLRNISKSLHPFLIALIPSVYIAANNLAECPGKEIVIASTSSLIITGICLVLAFSFCKKINQATFITSLFIGLLFSFGPMYDLLFPHTSRPLLCLLMLGGAFLGIFSTLIYQSKKRAKLLSLGNAFFSFFSLVMLAMISLQMLSNPVFLLKAKKIPSIITARFSKTNTDLTPIFESPAKPIIAQKYFPDIYYIILDGYARKDTLNRVFHYDNTAFETALSKKGFYIANQSTSNYPMTHLSLASSLSMEHINHIAAENGVKNCQPYFDRIRNPKIAQALKNQGYEYHTISSGWYPTSAPSYYSDHHYSTTLSKLSNYYQTLLAMTPLKPFIGATQATLRLYAFTALEQISMQHHKPKLVFLHLVMPHPPAYFDSQGNIKNITQTDLNHYFDKTEYIEQLIFLNRKVLEAVNGILKNSSHPPLIILQADHGSGHTFETFKKGVPSSNQIQERFPIFNAYFGPPEFQKMLYPTITPVNSFRVVFNYLQLDMWPLLPDTNYFQWHYDEAGIVDVTSEMLAMN